jgi:hypothetical protein
MVALPRSGNFRLNNVRLGSVFAAGVSALPLIVLQNAVRLIFREKTKQATIADQCALKRAN